MRAAAGIVTAAVLAVAAGSPALAAQAAEGAPARKCVMYQVGDLKVQVVRNRAMLEGAVDGQPVRVLIDTGAARSILFRAKALALHLPLSDVAGMRMGGVGGVTQVQSAYLDKLQLAGATLSNIHMLVAGEGRSGDFDILLGEDVLGRFDLEFDIPHGAVRLLEPRNCGEQDMAYWASAYNEAPFVTNHADKVLVDVKLNDHTVRAELDSGAATSVGTPRAAQAAQVRLETSDMKSHGLGALTLTSEVGVLDTFSIGQETIRNTRLRFADLFGATTFDHTGSLIAKHMDDEPDMLLGFDFLKSHRLLISRARHKVFFTYEGGPVFDTAHRAAPRAPVPPPAPAAAAPSGPATVPPASGASVGAGPSQPL